MAKKKILEKFQGYNEDYIANLLSKVNSETHDNICEKDYLNIARDACNRINRSFEGSFDA